MANVGVAGGPRRAQSEVGANARAFADFLQAGHAFTDFQDWRFTLPTGFVIGAC